VFVVALVGLGRYVMAFRHTADRAGLGAAFSDLLRDSAILVGLVGATFAIMYLWATAARARQERIAESHPGAIVVTCCRTNTLVALFKRGTLTRANDSPEMYFSVGFTLVADSHGIHLWGGNGTLRLLYEAPWNSIRDVIGDHIVEQGFRRRVLSLVMAHGDSDVHLPMIVLGNGLASLYSVSQARLDEVVGALEEMRATASTEHS